MHTGGVYFAPSRSRANRVAINGDSCTRAKYLRYKQAVHQRLTDGAKANIPRLQKTGAKQFVRSCVVQQHHRSTKGMSVIVVQEFRGESYARITGSAEDDI